MFFFDTNLLLPLCGILKINEIAVNEKSHERNVNVVDTQANHFSAKLQSRTLRNSFSAISKALAFSKQTFCRRKLSIRIICCLYAFSKSIRPFLNFLIFSSYAFLSSFDDSRII